jgi:hypothetical protein
MLPLAVFALVVSLVAGPVAFLLTLIAAGLWVGERFTQGAVGMCLLASVLPLLGLILSRMALKRIHERQSTSRVLGGSLATGGVCASLVGLVWCAALIVVVLWKQLQG